MNDVGSVYNSLGESIKALIDENNNLRTQLQEERSKLKSLKISYNLDVKDLRDQVIQLEKANSDLCQFSSNYIKENSGNPEQKKAENSSNVCDHIHAKKEDIKDVQNIAKEKEIILDSIDDLMDSSFMPPSSPTALAPVLSSPHKSFVVYKDLDNKEPHPPELDFNMLPTQYSTQDSHLSANNITIMPNSNSAEDEIEDSQNEFEETDFPPILTVNNENRQPLSDISVRTNSASSGNVLKVPSEFTELQKRDYMVKYYSKLFFTDPSYKVNLKINPITRKPWINSDFKPNPNYIPSKKLKKLIASTYKSSNFNINESIDQTIAFQSDLKWDGDQQVVYAEDISESQIYDKFPSPPGLLMSEFPDTQEELKRKKIVEIRKAARIKRRLDQCFLKASKREGEFIFQYDILNKFVKSRRYIWTSYL